jgi:hypothetical protein
VVVLLGGLLHKRVKKLVRKKIQMRRKRNVLVLFLLAMFS